MKPGRGGGWFSGGFEVGARTGHNVVIYRGNPAALAVDVGVEVFAGFTGHGEIKPVSTPSGEVATTAHFGEYSEMAPAYAALEQWWNGNGRRPAGVSWEVYGDWEDDPAKLRTDIYFLPRPAGTLGRYRSCSVGRISISLTATCRGRVTM